VRVVVEKSVAGRAAKPAREKRKRPLCGTRPKKLPGGWFIHVSFVFIGHRCCGRGPDFQKGNQNNKEHVPFCSFTLKSGLTIQKHTKRPTNV
jgi:hypothetical protein